jgi:hypothetical protein
MNPQRIVRQARDNHPRTRRSVARPKKKMEGKLVNKSGNKQADMPIKKKKKNTFIIAG